QCRYKTPARWAQEATAAFWLAEILSSQSTRFAYLWLYLKFLEKTLRRVAASSRSECDCSRGTVWRLYRRSSPSTRACFEFARLVCSPLWAAFGRTLVKDCALAVRPRLRLDMQNPSHSCRCNIAPPPPKPRRGPRGAGRERSEPVRLAVRDHHTRSLCKK